MTELSPATPEPAQPLAEDLMCTRCGYNLRGLTLEKLCPECGTPIARSVHGNLLRYADPDWVDKLRFGTALMLWNILIGVVLATAGAVIMVIGLPPVLISILSLIAGGLGLWAMFLVTTPEPAVALTEDPMALRKIVRVCAISNFVGSALQEAGKTGGWGVAVVIVGGILVLVGIVAHFGFFLYLRSFALRIPNEGLAKETRIVMWGFVAGFGLMIVTGIVVAAAFGAAAIAGAQGTATMTAGPAAPGAPNPLLLVSLGLFGCSGALALLVFSIWFLVLLFRYHAAFGRAVREARGTLLPGASSPPPSSAV